MGFYGGAFRGPFFVLRHHPPAQPPVVKGVTGRFLDMGIEEAVTLAKKAADGANVVILGAYVARQCLEAGLLDEIIVHVAPVPVGEGVSSLRAPVALRSDSRRSLPTWRARPRCCATRFVRRQRNDGETGQRFSYAALDVAESDGTSRPEAVLRPVAGRPIGTTGGTGAHAARP
ncbi:hypothetical protein GCM10027176_21680 [Actinoallomurus bryophytorum]